MDDTIIYVYQALACLFFAGFVVFLILYCLREGSTSSVNPATGCNLEVVSPLVVRNGYNNPYTMVFDHTTGTAMMAVFTTGDGTKDADYTSFLYTLNRDGTVTQDWEALSEVASLVPFNTNPNALVQQTVLSTRLGLITNGTFFWGLSLQDEFGNSIFSAPTVPSTGTSGTQFQTIGSVQEWSLGLVIHFVVVEASDAPAGSASQVRIFNKTGSLSEWTMDILNPLGDDPNQGQFGLNFITVSDESILWGTEPAYLYDYNPPTNTWVPISTSNMNQHLLNCKTYAMPRDGLELFILTANLQLAHYIRLSHAPMDDAERPDIRMFYFFRLIDTNFTPQTGNTYQMRANNTSLCMVDATNQALYYHRASFGLVQVLQNDLNTNVFIPSSHQTNPAKKRHASA